MPPHKPSSSRHKPVGHHRDRRKSWMSTSSATKKPVSKDANGERAKNTPVDDSARGWGRRGLPNGDLD
jgi:hypothetical protein